MRTLWIWCMLFCSVLSVHATDIRFEVGIAALDSNIMAVDYIGLLDIPDDENTEYHLHGMLQFDQPLTDYLSFTIRAFQDPMLQRRVLGRLNFTYGWFTVQAGPFVSLFNTSSSMANPGISALVGVNIPHIGFGSARGDTTIRTSIDGYTQNEAEIIFGLSLFPMIVPSLSADFIYTERKEAGFTIGRKQNRYSLSLDTTGPNGIYGIHLTLGYQELGWTVYHPSQTVIFQLNSVYGGVYVTYQIIPGIKIMVGGIIPVYSWITKQEVTGSIPKNPVFYDFTLGFIWSGNFRRGNSKR